MPYIHPLLAILSVFLVFLAFKLGFTHFLSVRRHQPKPFPRAKHIKIGGTALALLFIVPFTGEFAADLLESNSLFQIPEGHSWGASIILALAGLSLLTGAGLSFPHRHRVLVKRIHLIANTLLCPACLAQLATGLTILQEFLPSL